MPRVTRGGRRRQKRKKILARAKGYYQAKSKLYRYAKEAVDRSLKFSYIGRRLKKRDFRSLWIIRIGAGARQHGLSYSRFVYGLQLAGISINRKILAEMAVRDPDTFAKLTAQVSQTLEVSQARTPEVTPQPLTESVVGKPATNIDQGSPPSSKATSVKTATTKAAASPPAKSAPSRQKRKQAVKKTTSKAAPKDRATTAQVAKSEVEQSGPAKRRKSSVEASRKKATKRSKASRKSEDTATPSNTTSSD